MDDHEESNNPHTYRRHVTSCYRRNLGMASPPYAKLEQVHFCLRACVILAERLYEGEVLHLIFEYPSQWPVQAFYFVSNLCRSILN
jgi:hypothetical protein